MSAGTVERMMKLQDVILKAMGKKINWREAAEIIGVCDRTMRRMREGYRKFGCNGLMDRRKGKYSFHRSADGNCRRGVAAVPGSVYST
jgi:hypothetical protein